MSTRRNFLIASGAFSLCANLRTPLGAEAKPLDKFDLIIKSGEVIDPSQGLRGKRDIGIRHGRVAALEMDIPVDPAQGRRGIIDATGKIVTPGLVDLHSHIWPYGNILGISADQLVNTQGTTTLVSAGDVGASSFAAFRPECRGSITRSHFRFHQPCEHWSHRISGA